MGVVAATAPHLFLVIAGTAVLVLIVAGAYFAFLHPLLPKVGVRERLSRMFKYVKTKLGGSNRALAGESSYAC